MGLGSRLKDLCYELECSSFNYFFGICKTYV